MGWEEGGNVGGKEGESEAAAAAKRISHGHVNGLKTFFPRQDRYLEWGAREIQMGGARTEF